MFQRFSIKNIAPVLASSIALTTFCGFAAQSLPTPTTPQPINPIGQSVPFEGITWQLSEWRRSNGDRISLLPKNPITIRLDGRRLGGSSGCNSYGADYQVQNGQLRVIGDFISTMIGCSLEVGVRENEFRTILKSPRLSIRSAKNRLTLNYSSARGSGVLVFTPLQSKLQNTSWQLRSISTLAPNSVRIQPPITLQFTTNSVMGFSGCNRYNATYQEPANQLKIGAIASTKKGCATPQMQLEQNYLSSLATVQRYELDSNDNLRLFFANGTGLGVMTFTQQK
ncbi:META domain-containing protein [Leptolyngbya sp. AN03gr2]|uniref:META domain-containing protein n=1 Tax=unclassified Leptolyngbya TaxID=2650499 RepID=UPI003D31B69D